jgi:hypothetical protein
MRVRRVIVLSILVTGVAILVPAAALAAAHGTGQGPKSDRAVKATDRPLEGTSIGTNTINVATGAATYESSGHLSHFGKVTGRGVQTITLTGPNTISFSGSGLIIAADGDQLFATISGTATLSSNGAAIATTLNTITGGTGRFAGATGTLTVTSRSTLVSSVGSTESFDFTSTTEGHISY